MVVQFVLDPLSMVLGFVLGAIVTFVVMGVVAVRMRNRSVGSEAVVAPEPVRTRKGK